MDAARLNFSHGVARGARRPRARTSARLRQSSAAPLALIADLQGPKLRVGDLDGAACRSRRGSHVIVVGAAEPTAARRPAVSPAVVAEVLEPGHDVLIDDGLIRLQRRGGRGRPRHAAASSSAATVTAHKGVNLPGVAAPDPVADRKDIDDLEFALGLGVDYVALSFVRSAADVARAARADRATPGRRRA